MRLFRVSISTLVLVVLMAAFDMALLRRFPRNDRTWLDFFSLPMANILLFAFYRDRNGRRRGERNSFLLGFQLLGWAMVLTYLGGCRVFPQQISFTLASTSEWVHVLTLDNLDFDTMKRLDPTFGLAWRLSKTMQLASVTATLTIAMLSIAATGGAIVRWRSRAAWRADTSCP